MDGATVSVAVVNSRTEAELIVGMLRSHGLSAALAADDAGGQEPQWQMEGVRVLVPPRMKPWPVVFSPPSMTPSRTLPDRSAASSSRFLSLCVDLPDIDWSAEAVFGATGRMPLHLGAMRRRPTEGVVMPSYRMVYRDNEQVVRETYRDVDVDREDGWTTLFRGNDAILRGRDEHMQSFEVFDEAGPGEPAWKPAPQ